MTHKIRLPFIFLVTFLISRFPAKSQGDMKELAEKVGNTRNFNRIQKIAADYFKEEKREEAKRKKSGKAKPANEEGEFENGEVFYHRWALINGSHLDAAGNITNYKQRNMEAIQTDASLRTNTLSSNSNWYNEGPRSYTAPRLTLDGQARVDCIAFHPTDANTMYAGTPIGGLWKTTNGGTVWSQVNGLYPFLGIAGIVVNSSNGNEVWALAGSAENPNTWGIFSMVGGCRVYHSVDGGVNWTATQAFAGIGGDEGNDLVQSATVSNTLFAATGNGVYRTTDGGNNWTLTTLTSGVFDLEVNPTSGRIYAVGAGFVKYSSNNGTDWFDASFDFSISGMNRGSIAISSTGTNNTLYLLAGPAGTGTFKGLYKSTNGGLSFFRQSNTPNVFDNSDDNLGLGKADQSGYDNCIVAHPTDATKILTGGCAIWQSNNSGITMTFNTYYWNSSASPTKYVHPDVHSIKRNPVNNKIYACTDGGVWVSSDFGANWYKNTDGLSAAQVFHMTTYKNNFFMEAFGSQDNGVKIRRNSGSYEQFSGADGYCVQFALNDSSIMYASQNAGFAKFGAFGGTDLPVTYPFVTAEGKWYILHKTMQSVFNTEVLFAAALDTLSRSLDGGATWTTQLRRANWDIATAPSNKAYVYTAGGINYSSPAGFTLSRNVTSGAGTWTNISGTLGNFNQRAMKIAVDPFDEDKIYVCLGGYTAGQKVYRSLNGGTTWSTNISYNLPNVPVNALAADKAGNVYAGTDIGVYVLPNGTTQWVAFYNSLPRIPVTDLIINEDNQYIKAATFGCGIWKSNLYGGCPTSALVAFNQTGRQTFEASDFVNGFQTTMSGGYDFTDVRMRSGNYITFTPGTNLKNGTLIASIGPCGEPFPARIINPKLKDSTVTKQATEGIRLEEKPIDQGKENREPADSKTKENAVRNKILPEKNKLR